MTKIYDERLIGAFVSETKRDKIMEMACIGKGKYYRLKSDPDFIKVVNERRAEIVREAVLKMEGFLSEDVDRLQEIIRSPETSAQIRINAIQLLMSQLANWRTITDIEGRLLALETQVENQT